MRLLTLLSFVLLATVMGSPAAFAQSETYDKDEKKAAFQAARVEAVTLIDRALGQPVPVFYEKSNLPVFLDDFIVSADERKIWGTRHSYVVELDMDAGTVRWSDKGLRSLVKGMSSKHRAGILAVSEQDGLFWTRGDFSKKTPFQEPPMAANIPANKAKYILPHYVFTWQMSDLSPISSSVVKDQGGVDHPFVMSADGMFYARAWKEPGTKHRERLWRFYDAKSHEQVLSMEGIVHFLPDEMENLLIYPDRNRFFFLGNNSIHVWRWPDGEALTSLDLKSIMRPLYEREKVLGLEAAQNEKNVSYTRLVSVREESEFLICARYYEPLRQTSFLVLVRDSKAVGWRHSPGCSNADFSFSADGNRYLAQKWVNVHEKDAPILEVVDATTLQTVERLDIGEPFHLSEGKCAYDGLVEPEVSISYDLSDDGQTVYYGLQYSRFPKGEKKSEYTVEWDWRQDLPCPSYLRVLNAVSLADGGSQPSVKILD